MLSFKRMLSMQVSFDSKKIATMLSLEELGFTYNVNCYFACCRRFIIHAMMQIIALQSHLRPGSQRLTHLA